jgi:mannose-6-phosphate isomerase
VRPETLTPNQFPHFYRGGRQIEQFRGLPTRTENMPEDWVGSMTTRFGEVHRGLSELPDGRLLRDAVAADPLGWLGPEHLAAFGPETDLLVKLLDAGERLVVHAHPDREFARRHLGCRHGKTEAWIVLETREPQASVHLAFREEVGDGQMRAWVDGQDSQAMLAALNEVRVQPGDAILVPAGMPHAIGEGALIVELQEPTDFSILLEWRGFDIDGVADGHLGLGFDLALTSVDRSRWTLEALEELRGPPDDGRAPRARVLPSRADSYFRAERLRRGAELDASFSILVATAGAGQLHTQHGGCTPVERGETLVVPFAAGPAEVRGDVQLIRCLPPDPAAPGGP